MRVVLTRGPSATTEAVRTALAGRWEIDETGDLEEGVARTVRRPDSALVMVWPAVALGRAATLRLLGVLMRSAAIAIVDPELTEDRVAITESGASYLSLPFEPAELVWRLDHLEEPGRTRRRWLGDICVDELARATYRAGTPLELPRKEFDLLAHFVAYPRIVLSREALLEAVWGSRDYTPNVVEVTVSSVRRRLEAHGPRVIHTVRGVGYIARPVSDPEENLLKGLARRAQLVADRDALLARRDVLRRENAARREQQGRAG